MSGQQILETNFVSQFQCWLAFAAIKSFT